MSEFIRLQANGADAYPDASTENTYRPNGTSVESALVNLESNVTTLGGVAGDAKALAEQNSVKIATAEQEISDINSSLNDYHSVNIGTECKATRIGNLVHIYSTGWALLDSLPIGYRPIEVFYFAVALKSNGSGFNHIKKNGEFEIKNIEQIFSATFFTNDPMPQ